MRSRAVSFALASSALVTVAAARPSKRDGDGGSGLDKTGIHGTIACLVWLIFVIGATFMRLLKIQKSWMVHASIQVTAAILAIAGFALGVQLAGSNKEWDDPHVVIGIITFVSIWVIASGGILQHLLYRKYQKRTVVGVIHAWFARTIITLAFINGGLGLALAGGHGAGAYAAYAVVAAVVWLSWVGVTVWSMKREGKKY